MVFQVHSTPVARLPLRKESQDRITRICKIYALEDESSDMGCAGDLEVLVATVVDVSVRNIGTMSVLLVDPLLPSLYTEIST